MAQNHPLSAIIVGQIVSLSAIFILATCVLVLRIYTRLMPCLSWQLQIDDGCIIAAWVNLHHHLFMRIAVLNASSVYSRVLAVQRLIDLAKGAGIISNIAWSLSKIAFAFTLLRLATGQLRWILWFLIASMNVLITVWTPLFQNACRPYSHLPCLTTNQTQKFAVFVAGKESPPSPPPPPSPLGGSPCTVP
ncbi:uncharacterized protein CCOS01_11435 [Colletotrichum costaricense]|uniref:Integral membrane protein n=1 Tax=Colletotrichum costaricense TaxID=1209916 RepID=A0AAI9YP27_9PEZI|nr:uncharacterized protein CCOS01_11435 [Colletotrichum costaricense]KAK1518615.1 hypothetical protein CCOS01_11435 [Colletotrichum costaricense]